MGNAETLPFGSFHSPLKEHFVWMTVGNCSNG